MKVVEYWHGTIKNYRYDGDVSSARVATEGGGSSSENMDRMVEFLHVGCDGAS